MLLRASLLLIFVALGHCSRLKEVKSWKVIDFDFPDEESKKWALDSGYYKPENNLALGLEVYKNKIFVTVPRWKSGVPSSLNIIPLDGPESPILKPYPNWTTNNVTDVTPETNETKIINVFRVRVDNCDRLWVVDCGLDEIVGHTKVLSSPKLLVFDLKTDKLIREYKLKSEHVKENSFFANLVIDSDKGKCENSFAFIPDLGGYGLIVYDWAKNDAWRVEHHYFHFDPVYGDYNIGGVNFQWTDGIFGVSLKKEEKQKHKTLYFHPLSSLREFKVSTEFLKDKKNATSPENYHRFQFIGMRSDHSQSTTSAIDPETGIMFYTLVNKNAVGCWNSKTHPVYSPTSNGIVESNNETMIFPNDLILDKENNVWVLTDRLPVFLYRSLNTNDVNFRILMSPIREAVKDTVCEAPYVDTITQASTTIDVSTSTSVKQSTNSLSSTASQSVQGMLDQSAQSSEHSIQHTTTEQDITSSTTTTTTAQPSTTSETTINLLNSDILSAIGAAI